MKKLQFILFAIILCAGSWIDARKNKQQIFITNNYKNIDGQPEDVGITMLWKDSAFPYRTQQQDHILKNNQTTVIFKAPYSTQYLTEMYVVPARNLHLTWQEYTSAENLKTIAWNAAVAASAGFFISGFATDKTIASMNQDSDDLVESSINWFNHLSGNELAFGDGMMAGMLVTTILICLAIPKALWNLADIKKGKNRAAVHQPHHTFFNIEDVSDNSQIKDQTQIGIRSYESQEKYAQELEKTAVTALAVTA